MMSRKEKLISLLNTGFLLVSFTSLIIYVVYFAQEGLTMKRKGQGRKEFVILHFDDYENKWKIWSKPLTIKQASFIMIRKNPNYYKVEAL